MVKPHPAAQAAKDLAAIKAAIRQEEVQKEINLTNELGLRYLHIRAKDNQGAIQPKGGATVGYLFVVRDNVEVAVATCHKVDLYSKATGRLQAAKNFGAGKRIQLRIPKGMTAVQFLQMTFYGAGQPDLSN